MGCRSVIWTSPTNDERSIIERLIDIGMPVVLIYRADVTDWLPMVAADFVYAGFQAGSYLRLQNCKKVKVLGYTVNSENKPLTMSGGIPNGLLMGIGEGMGFDILDSEGLSREITTGYDVETSNFILDIIENTDEDEGIVFTNPYNFRNMLRDVPQRARSLLMSRKFVVIANTSVIRKISHFVEELNFPVIVEPYEDIARISLEKVINVSDGQINETKTLVKPYFQMFWDIKAALGSDDS